MSSPPLDVKPGNDDSNANATAGTSSLVSRRSKRTRNENAGSSVVKGSSGVMSLPILLIMSMLTAIYQFMVHSVLGRSSLKPIQNFVQEEKRENETLRKMPIEQEQQQRDIQVARRDQKIISNRLDDLQKRVQRLEERRKLRERGSASNTE